MQAVLQAKRADTPERGGSGASSCFRQASSQSKFLSLVPRVDIAAGSDLKFLVLVLCTTKNIETKVHASCYHSCI